MLKFGKCGVALALALVMSLAIFTSGSFAQSVNSSTANHATQAVVATTMLQGATAAIQTSRAQPAPRGFGFRGGFFRSGFGFHRRFFHHRFFFRHRFFPGFFGGGFGGFGGCGGCGC